MRKEVQLTSVTSDWGRTRTQDYRELCKVLGLLPRALDKLCPCKMETQLTCTLP